MVVASGEGYFYLFWVTIRMSVIGPLLGIGFGVASCIWLELNQVTGM